MVRCSRGARGRRGRRGPGLAVVWLAWQWCCMHLAARRVRLGRNTKIHSFCFFFSSSFSFAVCRLFFFLSHVGCVTEAGPGCMLSFSFAAAACAHNALRIAHAAGPVTFGCLPKLPVQAVLLLLPANAGSLSCSLGCHCFHVARCSCFFGLLLLPSFSP